MLVENENIFMNKHGMIHSLSALNVLDYMVLLVNVSGNKSFKSNFIDLT